MEKYWRVLEEQFGSTACGTYTPDDYRRFLQLLLEALGLPDAAGHLEVVILEQPYASGVAFDLSQGNSRRAGILIRPAGSACLLYCGARVGTRSALPA